MNEFHFFFETFLNLNNFKIYTSVCFFARMPEVFSPLERRNGESRSGEKNRFAVDLSSPKDITFSETSRFCPEGFNDAEKILLTLRARLFVR